MKQKGSKEKLKPLSLYGLDTRDVIRAFMKVKPERIRELEDEERKEPTEYSQTELDYNRNQT